MLFSFHSFIDLDWKKKKIKPTDDKYAADDFENILAKT